MAFFLLKTILLPSAISIGRTHSVQPSSLKLRQIYWESEDKYVYSYVSKPFELTMSLEKDTFIPLVCYCSFWYDAEDKVTRCCGENFIKPDLSSDILKNVPHYYVLGIKFY